MKKSSLTTPRMPTYWEPIIKSGFQAENKQPRTSMQREWSLDLLLSHQPALRERVREARGLHPAAAWGPRQQAVQTIARWDLHDNCRNEQRPPHEKSKAICSELTLAGDSVPYLSVAETPSQEEKRESFTVEKGKLRVCPD